MTMTHRMLSLPARLTRAAVRLVALFGRAAWGEAFKAHDLPSQPVPANKYRNTVGRPFYCARIHLGGASIRKVRRCLACGSGILFTVGFFAVSQRTASPIRAPA
jgi:hypothetical protein